MKRSIARWSTALAATAWLAVPATGLAQTPPPASPAAQQPTPASGPAQQGSAREHIRQAKAALNDIPAASIPATAKPRFNDLKRHLTALEKSAGSSAAATAAKAGARAKSNWATDVAAIDKTLTELLGSATTTGAGEPAAATGTAGTKGTTPSKTVALDETAKSKLMEVRTHVTAFAAAMSGSSSAPSPSQSPSEPQTDPAAAAAANQPAASPNQPSAATPSSAMPPGAAAPAPGAASAAAAQQPTQPPTTAPATADADTAKRHLTAARDSLSQLTQLPAAAQLTGDTRTQVSQLITNFNRLISATTDWRAEYDKVNANLTALIGADQPQAPTSTPGAVGTSGTATANLDPAIREKLVEFRSHLSEFAKAAGGGSMANSPSAATPDAGAAPAAATPPATTPPATAASAPATAASAPATAASPDDQQRPSTSQRPEAMTQDSAIRHIEAIEAILNGRSAPSSANMPSTTTPGSTPPSGNPPSGSSTSRPPAGAAGTTGTLPAASITLDRAQLDEIRMHLAELRKVVDKK